jgi:hypothetical protein
VLPGSTMLNERTPDVESMTAPGNSVCSFVLKLASKVQATNDVNTVWVFTLHCMSATVQYLDM